MPIYEYEHERDPAGCELGSRFERLQRVDDPPLRHCPRCGQPCHRVLSVFAASTACQTAASELERRGFTRYQRGGKGTYEKTAGDGPDELTS